jgi:hypothetical protein
LRRGILRKIAAPGEQFLTMLEFNPARRIVQHKGQAEAVSIQLPKRSLSGMCFV